MGVSAVELMARVCEGDSEAFGALMALYDEALRAHLGRYAGPADAEDLVQELWLRVWQRARQWDGRGRPLAWMLAVGTNLALDHLRKRRGAARVAPLEEEEGGEATVASMTDAVVPGPEEQALWREELSRVRAAMATLPAAKREALRLVRIEGHSLREAAEEMGVPVGTLKSRIHHAHRLLMEELEDET